MTAQPATIQVQYVNQPREANWSHGNVKDVNKQLWSVRKDRLSYFTQGETCDILWEQTGKYPEIIGKGGQLFPSEQPQPQPGTAAPRNASWPGKPQQELTYEKPPADSPPILSNVLAHAISAGVLTRAEELPEWAKWTNEAIKAFHAGASPAHQARSDIDSQYGVGHPDAPPMGDPNDPGYQ